MLKSKVLIYFLCSFSLLAFNAWAKAEKVNVPGTSVTMHAPKGFELSETFTGYFNASNNSSVLFAEFPKEAFGQLNQIFSNLSVAKDQFAQQGVNILEADTITSGSGSVIVLIGTQSVSGLNVDKYLALFKGDKTVMATYNIFDTKSFSRDDAIESIKSIVVGKALSLKDKLKQLSFTFDGVSPFKAVDVLAGSTVILTSFDGIDKSGELPLIAISSSLTNVKVDDEKVFSKELLRSIRGFEQSEIKSEGLMTFSGVSAYKVEAESNNKTVIQVVALKGDGTYLRFISTGNSQKMKKLAQQINTVISSVNTKG